MATKKQTRSPVSVPNYPADSYPPSTMTERLLMCAAAVGFAGTVLFGVFVWAAPGHHDAVVDVTFGEAALLTIAAAVLALWVKRHRQGLLRLAPEDEISKSAGKDIETVRRML